MLSFAGLSVMKDMKYNNNEDGESQQRQNAKHKEFARASGSKKRRKSEGAEEMRVNRAATRRSGGDGSPFGRDKADGSHIPSMEDEPAFSKSATLTATNEAADELTSQPEFL
ncbi:unnamed protein product [Linum trigynum]|uniref:Uncharacterized protein n=1 Tax=Linum trigynum TaxID=586398 RepID=A0AAV2E3E0_9ROSI